MERDLTLTQPPCRRSSFTYIEPIVSWNFYLVTQHLYFKNETPYFPTYRPVAAAEGRCQRRELGRIA